MVLQSIGHAPVLGCEGLLTGLSFLYKLITKYHTVVIIPLLVLSKGFTIGREGKLEIQQGNRKKSLNTGVFYTSPLPKQRGEHLAKDGKRTKRIYGEPSSADNGGGRSFIRG